MPNSFYRFSNAWNAGFYPDNQITTNQLNDIYVTIDAWLPGYFPGKTFIELKNAVKAQVAPFNQFPVLGNFEVIVTTAPDPPFVDYYIYIRNVDLYQIDNNQTLIIVGQYNASNNLIVTCTLTSFTPGSYSGTFNSALVDAENNGVNALKIAGNYGSAVFPLYYGYNSVTNIATSGLARASTLQLDTEGNVLRLPVDTLPKQNIRRFNLPALSPEDKFVVTFLERIINTSITDQNETVIQATYDSLGMPDGWTKTWVYSSTGYERIQVTVAGPDDRSFAIVGRLDGEWLWQRFVNDIGDTTTNGFLTTYSPSTALPFIPISTSRYVYLDIWYDFDLCDFDSNCYVSPEFYPMPGIPGDTLQFNVPIDSGNLTGLDSVKVGLFQQDGGFVQKIGDAILEQKCCCNQYVFTREYTALELDFIRGQINANIGPGGWQYYFFISNGTEVFQSTSEYMPEAFIDTPSQLNAYFSTFSGPFIFSVNITGEDWETATGTITITTLAMTCDEPVLYMNEQIANQLNPITPYASSEFTITSGGCDYVNINQFYASCTIPAVANGCYRLGMYDEPSTTCDMTFEYTLSGEDLTNYLDTVNTAFGSLNPYISWILVTGDVYVYQVVSDATTAEDIADYCNVNIPGMTVTLGEGSMTFVWVRNDLPCGDIYSMTNCLSDVDATTCFAQLWVTDSQTCECGDSYYLYSLSNIVNIDSSDCFSTILEFWSDDNTVAEGFEYYNGWKQRIRIGLNGGGEKPVIEESLYRQSNGVHRRPQNKQDLSIDLHTDFFDLETQLAMTDATRHPYIVWNNQGIFVKGDIEVATIQDFTTQS
ncbi:MAG: hypothetical protein ACK5DE_08705, partial [Bacteroidota bacterium]